MAARVTGPSGEDPVSGFLRAQEEKDLLRLVTIGSVDDGKSTLIGRLLHDAHGLYQDQLDAVRRASLRGSTRAAGSTSEIDFSLFTDGLLAEREQGITIDVAYRYFSTARRKFILADTPGHVQYTRNMATGASTADVAVILVDARLGVVAQTRRHAQIASLLGIPHVVACVNKMDLVAFDQEKFVAIASALESIGSKLGLRTLHAIPVSALAGDNVVDRSARMPWWTGATLLDHLEAAPARAAAATALRFPVQLVLRPGLAYRGFAGQLASGTISTGDEIVALPSMKRTRVTAVEIAAHDVDSASAPMSVAIRLADEIDVSRGDMFVHAGELPHVSSDFEADVVWMSERALDRGKTYLLKHTTRTVRAELEVVHGTDPETLSPRETDHFTLNDVGRVRVHAHAPLFFDAYGVNRVTGAFILVDSVTNATVAAGMVVSSSARAPEGARTGSQIGTEERRERIGQSGLTVRVLAPTTEEALRRAFALERELFDRGRVATVLDGEHPASRQAAEACVRAGLVALVADRTSSAREGDHVTLEIEGDDVALDGAVDVIHARSR